MVVPRLPVLGLLAVMVAYFCGAMTYYGLLWTLGEHLPVWLPAGIILAVLLRTEPKTWPYWLLTVVPAGVTPHLIDGFSLASALGIMLGDTVDAVVGAWLITRFTNGRFRLDSLRDLAVLVICAGMIAPVPGGLVGSFFISAESGVPYTAYAIVWWSAVFSAVVLIAPAFILWPANPQVFLELGRKRFLEFLGLLLVLVVVLSCILILGSWIHAYLTIPILMIIAIRFRPLECSIANLVMSIVTIGLSMFGHGKIGLDGETSAELLTHLQIYISFVAIGPSLCIALVLRDRQREHRARTEGESRWQGLMDNVPFAIGIRQTATDELIVNNRFVEWFGEPVNAVRRPDMAQFLPPVPEQDADGESGGAAVAEFQSTLRDGEVHDLKVVSFPLRNQQGEITGIGAVGRDVTEETRARQQLIQAQKMEAVGQLTGGVAHDFNNLLAIIIGSLEIALDDMESGDRNRRYVQQSFEAAERGADLTRQLLAFSRQQPLRPARLDLNRIVTNLGPLVQRTLGEHIAIDILPEAGAWECEADPSQVESALVNLAINARDAMPDGGRITIETRNVRLDDDYTNGIIEAVKPGEYVMIAVTDTGTGMPEDIREHVFEPFFTTKDRDKGSGLGLAMVHGFVKQSGGHVSVYSEVGLGTTVKIYLPRADAGAQAKVAGAPENSPKGGQETVLLVEDDDKLRELTREMLTSLGYAVEAARDGTDAVALWQSAGPFDMLLTDVVLPGELSGPRIAATIRETYPGLQVLYMSGYTANGVVHHGRLDEGVDLLEKPFRRAELAKAIRRTLEQA